MRRLSIAVVGLVAAIVPTSAAAIINGTDQVSDGFASNIAYLELKGRGGTAACTGTLISSTVVMTAAHCVYDTTRSGNLIGVIAPSQISVRVGSRNVSDPALGVAAGVVAVLPQPYYRWDGTRHFHDIALLALDRAMPQIPAKLPEQHPDPGKPLLIAGYGQTSDTDQARPSALKAALIAAAEPASCKLVDETFDPQYLFCGAATTDPTYPGGTACHGDSGGPAFSFENTAQNLVVEGIISYGSRAQCEFSRTYLVLVSSENGFIAGALATPATAWSTLRDDPPTATVRALTRRVGKRGVLRLRIDDDHSANSRTRIDFYTKAGRRVGGGVRSVKTNQWVTFSVGASSRPFNGFVCVIGTDKKKKLSNTSCALDVVT